MGQAPDKYDKEQIKAAKKRAKEVREFYEHLFSYIGVNTFLFFIDLFTGSGLSWWYWPLLGWGIGIFIHATSVFSRPFVDTHVRHIERRELRHLSRDQQHHAQSDTHIENAQPRHRPFVEKLKESVDGGTLQTIGQEISKAMRDLEINVREDLGLGRNTESGPTKASKIPQGVSILMFTDMEGFTSYVEQYGDDDAHRILTQHHQLLRNSVQNHDGIEIKSMGDGLMLCFVSAKKALICAAEIQQKLEEEQFPLRVRIGLHAGEPIQSGEDLTGQTVNLAARVMDHANGGQILMTDVIKSLAGPIQDYQYIDMGQRRLPGLTEPQQLYEFVGIAPLTSPLDTEVDQRLEQMEKYLGRE